MHNWPLLPGCLLEEVENTCVDLRLWRLGIRQRPWLLSLEDRWWCGSPSDLVWLCGWDEGQESWKTTASVFRPTSCEQQTVVGAACCHGNALRITEASFSILNIWIWTIIMFREALIMNINVSHMMFLNIFDSSEIFMCKRWKRTFQFHPHPAVMEVLEQLTQPNSCFHEWLVCTNTMRTKWTQPCVSAWEWLSRRTLGGGEPPKQQPNKSNTLFQLNFPLRSLNCCSDLNEHFQLHSEAHDFQRYRGNPAHIRIDDVIREAESVRLLVRVAVQTEHISSSLEGKEQTFISSNLKRLAEPPLVKPRASAFKAVLSTNLSRKYANDLSEKSGCKYETNMQICRNQNIFFKTLCTHFSVDKNSAGFISRFMKSALTFIPQIFC